jgi:excisionase family DNA binding protein
LETAVEPIALRIAEAVAVSRLGRTTLYGLIARGELRAVKVGGRRLILRADLDAYFDRLRAAA